MRRSKVFLSVFIERVPPLLTKTSEHGRDLHRGAETSRSGRRNESRGRETTTRRITILRNVICIIRLIKIMKGVGKVACAPTSTYHNLEWSKETQKRHL